MRFKVDENLPVEAVDVLRRVGHDAVSVAEQGLSGAIDTVIGEVSRVEGRRHA